MKKYIITIVAVMLALSLSACGFGRRNKEETRDTTNAPEIQTPTTMPAPTLPPVTPNVPQETESRGSTDDITNSPNESLPEEARRIRRRIMG